jgi:hypothetical protein
MSHVCGRLVNVGTRVGPESGSPPSEPGFWELLFWPFWDDNERIAGQQSKASPALAAFDGRLHMVHLGDESNDIWYSSFDGQDWTENERIAGQQSKASPALAAFDGRLHMVHLGDESNDIWYSAGRPPRFVFLHFNDLSFPGGERLEVDLGYGMDTFDGSSDQDAWTRPIDPLAGPIRIRYFGTGRNGGATLVEYGRGEPTATGMPPGDRASLTNVDLFLHTAAVGDEDGCDPYDEPIYETRLKCGAFDWQNIALAAAGSVEERAARAVCCLVHVTRDEEISDVPFVSTCSATLIDRNHVLTAAHCVDEPNGLDVDSASVVFGYETTRTGCKPNVYAPRIFKVTGALRGSADWAILEIAPPGGIGVVPAALRPSGVFEGDPVIPIHHPLGAVKKFQKGTLSTDDLSKVEGFDYAGGSSGSPLFDSSGQIVGVLSGGGDGDPCHVNYTAATTILDELANPRAPAAPLDVMLVMDRSRSMAEPGLLPGRTKMQEARDAASLFVRLLREDAGDRIGLVSFSTTATRPPDSALGNVNQDKKDELVGPSSPYTGGAVGALAPEGATSVGDGLSLAARALVPDTNERAILVMTDGLQNTPPMIEAGEGGLGPIRLAAIGFGTESDLDSAALSRMASRHRGFYTRANDGLDLKRYFALAFGNTFESGALSDRELDLPTGQEQTEEQRFSVCLEERISAVVGWDDPSQTLAIDLRTPAGVVVTEATAGVDGDRGEAWHFLRVPLPLNDERAGAWHWRVRRVGGEEVGPAEETLRLFVTIIALGGPRFEPVASRTRIYTCDALTPQVALRYEDGTAPHAEVTLEVEAPNAAVGQLVTDAGLAKPTTDDDPLSGFFATLKKLGGGEPYRLATRHDMAELSDDGAHHDGAMERDGIYGNLLTDLTCFEGTYRVHARARIEDPCPAQPETQWAIQVDLGIDPRETTVTISDTGPGPGGHRAATVVIMPRDCNGNPLGPGRAQQVPVSGAPGTTTGAVTDNGDGSYSVSTTWDPQVTDGPVVIASQPERPPVVLSPGGGGTLPRFPRWLWALLVLLALLLIALVIILLLTI